jgi:DNA repair exonuclease SbcCD ATPase subunit
MMLIQALGVEGIGRFAGAAQVEGFGPGVNVLAAGNEVGKSTLFRSIRTCLFSRHDSKAQDVKDLATEDSQLPATIALTFGHDGHTYVIRKSFLRSPGATLTRDGREIARSKQADEAIWDLLGIEPGSGRSLDDGAFGLLWVGQGASFTAPAPGTGATSLLNAAIESEVGALVGGERARQMLAEIQAELGRSLTDTGRPKSDGPLQRAMRDLEHWQKAEAERQAKLDALEQQLAELMQRRRRHRELTDPAAAAEMAQELLRAKESLADARSAARELRRLEAEESAARRALDGAAQRLKQHRDLCGRIDANRQAEASLAKDLPDQHARERETRAALARSQDRIAAVEQRRHALAAREHEIEKLSSAAVRAQRKEELARQLETVEQVAGELLETDAQLSQLKIKPKDVDELDRLDREIAALDAQLSAAAAHLAIELTQAGAGKVHIGAAQLDGNHTSPVLTPTRIMIGDLATIVVTPAANPRRETRETLDGERSALMHSLGVASVAEAHARLSRRRELDAVRKGIVAQLKSLDVHDDPAATMAKLKSNLAETQAAIAAALSGARRATLPDSRELQEERVALARERTALEGERTKLEETRGQQQAALETALALRSGTESRLELTRNTIAADLGVCADADRLPRDATLVAELAAAQASHQTATTTLTVMRQTAPDVAELERREARCRRLEEALDNQKNELMALERDIGRLTGQIQAAGGDGVGESLAAAREQRELADRELARIQERVATLQLLRDTVAGCLLESRRHYHEPVRRHLRPFLNDLFPGAELELGEGFSIDGIKRSRSEAFRRLSDGTQEQIAVLVRLAMGAMLAERGESVPIILDDALVYCDDDRIQRMFDALSRAGKHQQIIVLTCRLRTFAPLGGHTLSVKIAEPGGAAIAA